MIKIDLITIILIIILVLTLIGSYYYLQTEGKKCLENPISYYQNGMEKQGTKCVVTCMEQVYFQE